MGIAINHKRCLQNRFVKAKCTACRDICPTKSITEQLESGPNCINCGLCLAHCPVEAIAGDGFSVKAIEKNFTTANPLLLICQKHRSDSDWPCLGFLDPLLLFALIYAGGTCVRKALLYRKECAACNVEVARHLEWTVAETKRLLENHSDVLVDAQQACSQENAECITRRRFFNELWGASVITVRAITFPDSGELQSIPRHKLFYQNCGQMPSLVNGQTVFQTLAVDNVCNACGICTKVCPAKAISTVIANDQLVFSHNPLLCIHCGICVRQCGKKALTLLPAVRLAETEIARVGLPRCPDCGGLFQPIGDANVCLACLEKTKICC